MDLWTAAPATRIAFAARIADTFVAIDSIYARSGEAPGVDIIAEA